MAKQPKKNFCEFFENIDNELSVILKKCNNCTSVEVLKEEEIEKLKECICTIIKQNNVEQESGENIPRLKNCLEVLFCLLNSNVNTEIKLGFVNVIKYINSEELIIDEPLIKNLISKINEYWMAKMQAVEEIQGMEYFTLQHLLNLCTCEKPLMCDIQRLSAIRKSISAVPFEKAVPSLRPLLIKIVQKSQVLKSEHGQRFIAQALILSQKIMMEIHKTVMLDLSSCSKKKALDYGKIYILAWQHASEDFKNILEKACFQHLMETMIKEHRTSLELNRSSQNMLTVLEVWHSERKKKNPDFITMITNAYQPILWKYLQSGFNVHRCNATDVFFKAFPLQRSSDNAIDAEDLFNKQYDAMLASLTDDCHIIRIIGIREVCNILSLYWNSFNPLQIQSLMSVITKQNAKDVSTAEVRRMVYLGFQNLVKSSLSREYVKQILPILANNIHDINQKVRIAFIQLLICIKELKDPNFKYSDYVSMVNIQYRLAKDNVVVGQWIIKLLIRNYYHSKMSVIEWTKRFIYLIKTYKNSYRNFFFYSTKSLPFNDACTIIYEILSQIGAFVLSKFDQENNENFVEEPKEKKRKDKKLPLMERNQDQHSSVTETNSSKKCAFDDPDIISGLFDIVTILWILHDDKLNKPENEEMRFKLYDVYIKYAQSFINYYKDCNLFLGIITLSGNIPASLLRNNNITLPGYCIKMLKSIRINRSNEDDEKITSMLIALVKWGRGSEILEQIKLWLDAAFETKNMNETILPRRKVKITENIQPNSIVAINILDTLLKKEYVKLSILKKNYFELFSLWKYMSRVRKLIETRIDQGEPFEEELVSDEFLNRCFQRYVKLIPLLKEDETCEEPTENSSQNPNTKDQIFVNRQKEMENVIEWAENFLFPLLLAEHLEEEDANLIVSALEDIFYVADNMIVVHMVNNLFHLKIAHFALKILDTKFGFRFVKAASRIAVALNFSAKLLFKVKDDLQIFSTVIPSLLSHILDILTTNELTPKEVDKLASQIPTVIKCSEKILATYQDNLSSTTGLKENARQLKLVVGLYVDCIITIISQNIFQDSSTIPIFSSPSQLPPIANHLFSVFHNRKTWTPLFMHILSVKLSGKNFSAKDTVSCILLLHLYTTSDNKINETVLRKAFANAERNLNKLKESMGETGDQMGNIFSINETETATKKTWPSNAATMCTTNEDEGNCKPDGENNSSEENALETQQISENNRDAEKSENVQNFHCERNNLEMNFIKRGFELIENIKSLKEKQQITVEKF